MEIKIIKLLLFQWASSYGAERTSKSEKSNMNDDDYESQVLARLKKAQERKRQLQKEAQAEGT